MARHLDRTLVLAGLALIVPLPIALAAIEVPAQSQSPPPHLHPFSNVWVLVTGVLCLIGVVILFAELIGWVRARRHPEPPLIASAQVHDTRPLITALCHLRDEVRENTEWLTKAVDSGLPVEGRFGCKWWVDEEEFLSGDHSAAGLFVTLANAYEYAEGIVQVLGYEVLTKAAPSLPKNAFGNLSGVRLERALAAFNEAQTELNQKLMELGVPTP